MAVLCMRVLTLLALAAFASAQCLGSFRTMGDIGISPITVSQSKDGMLYLMDRRDLQNSKIRLPDGTFGHAVEYTPRRNTWRTIFTATNTWCSAGGYLRDGTIMNTAGNDAGLKAVRFLTPCSSRPLPKYVGGAGPPRCNEWWEDGSKLALSVTRWYPTAQILPDGRFIVVGGSTGGTSPTQIVPSYEFVDPYRAKTGRQITMNFLREGIPNFLYPFVHLLPSDYLFIFSNVAGIVFNYKTDRIVKRVPKIPDNIARSYPSTAASLLLPLSYTNGYGRAEVLICGGNAIYATPGTAAARSCYLTDVSKGVIDGRGAIGWRGPYNLARGRCMPDMLFLMDGTMLIINGVQKGVGGFQTASEPNLWPEILVRNGRGGIDIRSNYCPSPITRGYHSEAILIPDGRVFIAGSNAWGRYTTIPGNPFSTEYRVEMWSPPHVTQAAIPRPALTGPPRGVGYNRQFTFSIRFPRTPAPPPSAANVRVSFISNAFVTHSLSMGLRYVNVPFTIRGLTITATSPPNAVIAPPGPYMLAVTYRDIPAYAAWVMIG